MKDNEIACTAHADGLPRRKFLRNSLLMAVPAVMLGSGLPMPAAAAVYDPPARKRGSTVRSVRNYGAIGNGVHDDTAAFQAAINSLPSTGGTVTVPAGTYLIDAVRTIKLRSLMHLQMAPDAKLVAKPNSAEKYTVLVIYGIHDVEVSGGRIVGERDSHRGTGGEGGHGIRISGGERVTIRDIHVSKGWGDGITVGPRPANPYVYSRDIVIANVVCTGNRRNGLSIGSVIGMKVFDSEFSNTHGTSPECGIDVEPAQSSTNAGYEYNDQVWIENCVMRGNAKYGLNVWKNARRLTVTKCIVERNDVCGMVTRGLTGGSSFTGNMIRYNMSTGLFIQDGTKDLGISGNTFYSNYLKSGLISRTDFTLTGVTTKIRKDLIVGDGTSGIRVGKNYFK
jgi:polygalacturonase